MLAAGIDVWTTLNIQHLESLNDVVLKITKVRVRETVPDTVFDKADEIVLVDFPPDELLKRWPKEKSTSRTPPPAPSKASSSRKT